MERISKISAVLLNVLNLVAGVAVAIIMIFERDFAAVIVFKELSRNSILFLNLLFFQVGLTLLLVVISMLVDKNVEEIKFPVLYMILPSIIGIIGVYFGAVGDGSVEKIIVILASVIYVSLSGVLLYFTTKLFEGFSKTE